jgi:HEPN domain-containing protein
MTQEWVETAEGDANVVAEKYCKAWLVEQHVNFPRTHDLEVLAKLCLPSLTALAALMDDLRFLTSFAVEIRYPGTFASRQDAERCWQSAAQARALLREHLGLESTPEG